MVEKYSIREEYGLPPIAGDSMTIPKSHSKGRDYGCLPWTGSHPGYEIEYMVRGETER